MTNIEKIKRINKFIILFFVYIVIQLKFINDTWFGTDELDIMVLGKAVARGRLLYVDIFSQHMPFSYYISALFYKLGAVSVNEQRIAFYIFFSFIWTSIVFYYKKIVDYKILIISPLIFCCLIQNYDLGTAILSEHLAGCGALILILEYLSYIKNKKLSFIDSLLISFAIVLTLGTIFISIYALFFLFIGVILYEMKWRDKENVRLWISKTLRKYVKLGIVILTPWIGLIVYYVMSHSLSEFIYGAYTINRTIYPKYNDGTGGNVVSVFFQPIDKVASFIINGFDINSWTYVTMLQWIIVIFSLLFLVIIGKELGKVSGIVLFLYIYAFGTRGIFHFHGTACVELLAFSTAYSLLYFYDRCKNKYVFLNYILGFCVIVILSGYLNNISQFATLNFKNNETEQSKMLKEITDNDESVWMLMFDNLDMMLADRVPVGGAATTPWTWEEFGKKEFKRLKKNSPRVAMFDENHEVWENKLKDYAPKVIKYIKKNYTQIPGTTSLYVRNDYYNEAMSKIGK